MGHVGQLVVALVEFQDIQRNNRLMAIERKENNIGYIEVLK